MGRAGGRFVDPFCGRFAPSIHDSSDKVRAAVVELLLSVNAVQQIKFFEVSGWAVGPGSQLLPQVVSVEQLQLRLVLDSNQISRKCCELLIPSYMPHSQVGADCR